MAQLLKILVIAASLWYGSPHIPESLSKPAGFAVTKADMMRFERKAESTLKNLESTWQSVSQSF